MPALGIYRHYTETGEIMTVYNGLGGERRTWVRPFTMFESQILHDDKLVNISNNSLVSPPDYEPDPLEPLLLHFY